MEYLLLIYEDEGILQAMDQDAQEGRFTAFRALAGDMREAGVIKGGQPLESVEVATSVRVRGGQVVTTDGPFAETREQLIGYFMVDCADLDEALAWAARIPVAETGTIEVRPTVSH